MAFHNARALFVLGVLALNSLDCSARRANPPSTADLVGAALVQIDETSVSKGLHDDAKDRVHRAMLKEDALTDAETPANKVADLKKQLKEAKQADRLAKKAAAEKLQAENAIVPWLKQLEEFDLTGMWVMTEPVLIDDVKHETQYEYEFKHALGADTRHTFTGKCVNRESGKQLDVTEGRVRGNVISWQLEGGTTRYTGTITAGKILRMEDYKKNSAGITFGLRKVNFELTDGVSDNRGPDGKKLGGFTGKKQVLEYVFSNNLCPSYAPKCGNTNQPGAYVEKDITDRRSTDQCSIPCAVWKGEAEPVSIEDFHGQKVMVHEERARWCPTGGLGGDLSGPDTGEAGTPDGAQTPGTWGWCSQQAEVEGVYAKALPDGMCPKNFPQCRREGDCTLRSCYHPPRAWFGDSLCSGSQKRGTKVRGQVTGVVWQRSISIGGETYGLPNDRNGENLIHGTTARLRRNKDRDIPGYTPCQEHYRAPTVDEMASV